MKQKAIIFLLVLIIISCKKEQSEIRLSAFDKPIITGYEVRNRIGEVYGEIGVPNIKLGDLSNNFQSNNNYYMCCYPNPDFYSSNIYIYIKKPNSYSNSYIWITPAAYIGQEEQTNSYNEQNIFIADGFPIYEWEFFHANDIQIMIDIRNFPKGYYRLYFKSDNHILWDNIVII